MVLQDINQVYLLGGFLGIAIFFLFLDRLVRRRVQKRREKKLPEIAKRFGMTYTATDDALRQSIDHLMNGQDAPTLSNILRLVQGKQEIIMADYSHLIKMEKTTRRDHYTVVAMPIRHAAVPFFHLQSANTTHSNLWRKWPEVNIQTNDAFDQRFALKSIPPQTDEVSQFFADRPALVEFCLSHPKYNLTSDGGWLIWYNENQVLKLNEKRVEIHLGLALELAHHLGLLSDDKGSKQNNLSHTDATEYNTYVEQLKSEQKNQF